MKVLDHEPYAWFLFEDDGALYLDVHCSHSFVDYDMLMALNALETSAYEGEGRSYLNQLVRSIQYSAPGVVESTSPFKSRNLAARDGDETRRATIAAVEAWRAGRSG